MQNQRVGDVCGWRDNCSTNRTMVAHRSSRLCLPFVALAIAAPVCTSRSAWAGDPSGAPSPPPPGDPAAASPHQARPARPPLYTAPLSQTTQTTYVPQSVALSGPEDITDYDETRPPPLGYTPVLRTRKGLIIGGGVTLGVAYSFSALAAAIGEDTRGTGANEVAALWIPVAGPFVQLGRTESATGKLFLVGLGASQAAGAIMLIYGLTTPSKILVRNDLVGVTITPMLGPGTSGMMASGSF